MRSSKDSHKAHKYHTYIYSTTVCDFQLTRLQNDFSYGLNGSRTAVLANHKWTVCEPALPIHTL